jgi:hypothetical protein
MLAVDSLCVDSINGMAVTVELLIILFWKIFNKGKTNSNNIHVCGQLTHTRYPTFRTELANVKTAHM